MKLVPNDWYELHTIGDGISLIRERYVADWLRCNIWHVRGRERDLVVDAGMGLRPLKPELPTATGHDLVALASHCHFDHIGSLHEFDCRLGHRAEAHVFNQPTLENTSAAAGWIRAEIFSALPDPDFTPEKFTIQPAPLTGYVDEGDVIDLGDRVFRVFHLPGHSPGSVALYDEATRTLISGDVVYDGYLFDTVYHSDPEHYRQSLHRLRELPVDIVHAGHGHSFGRERMHLIIDEFLAGGRRVGDLNTWLDATLGTD